MKKTLRFVALFCVLLLAGFTAASPAEARSEEIISYDSFISVKADSSLVVTETIEVYAAGQQIKRGIYRDFPTIYKRKNGSKVVVGFKVLSVTKNGYPEPYHIRRHVNGKRVYIGKEECFLSPGVYTYAIMYETTRQIGFFDDHDELYWNVTGNDWAFPIQKAAASVELPAGAAESIMNVDGFTGIQGSMERAFRVEAGIFGPNFETTRMFRKKEGLTVFVSWAKGHVRPPGPAARLAYFLHDNEALILPNIFLALVFFYYLFVWHLVGKDPKKGTIIPLYHPPERMSPSAMRYLMHMGYDQKAFTASVIQMAVKGAIRIEEEEPTGLTALVGSLARTAYVLKKIGVNNKALNPVERKVLAKLFGASQSLSLTNTNHTFIKAAIDEQKKGLARQVEDVYFYGNKSYFYKGFFFSIVGGAGLFSFLVHRTGGIIGFGEFFPWFAVVGCNYLFFRLLKAPTMQGRKVMDQIEGFGMFLGVTEKERLNLLNPPEKTPELFEKCLPYALALNVEQKWAEQFTKVLQRAMQEGYSPSWYVGRSWLRMDCGGFSSSLGSSFLSAIASSSTPPGSSSGGSGFSGGGGGGGGGGGW